MELIKIIVSITSIFKRVFQIKKIPSKLLFFSVFVFSCISINCQVNTLFKKFFFDLPLKEDKFEIRTQMQANDIFDNINESSNSISAKFKYHPYIYNLSKMVKSPYFNIQFNDEGKSDIRNIKVYYSKEQINECLNKYQELIKLFKPYTKKSEAKSSYDSNTNEKMGKGLIIYPTQGAKFFLIEIGYSYNSSNEIYELEILMFENNLWSK